MIFTVTYREKSGALAEMEIEAADRGGCFAQCKARGIAPVKVAEGRGLKGRSSGRLPEKGQDFAAGGRGENAVAANGKKGAGRGGENAGAGRRRMTWKAAILAAICLAAGIGAWWWLGREEARPTPQPVEKPKAVSRPEARPSRPRVPPATNAPPATPTQAATNAPMTRRERMIAKYGKEPIKVRPGGKYKNGVRQPEKRSIFKYTSEKEIDRIISAKPGHRIIGRFAKGFIERDFQKSLEEKIEFTEEDTEEDIARKKQMIAVKEQLRQAIDKGESLEAILEDARKEVNALADFRDNMIKDLAEIRKSGATEQEIEDFYAAANKMLGEKNIKPLLSPFQIKEKILAIQQERENQKQEKKQ